MFEKGCISQYSKPMPEGTQREKNKQKNRSWFSFSCVSILPTKLSQDDVFDINVCFEIKPSLNIQKHTNI